MAIVFKFFKQGSVHPDHAHGFLLYNETDKLNRERDSGKYLAAYRLKYKTREEWNKVHSYKNNTGQKLSNDAYLYLWEEEENEFGPICP
jgi:hypothetical protein